MNRTPRCNVLCVCCSLFSELPALAWCLVLISGEVLIHYGFKYSVSLSLSSKISVVYVICTCLTVIGCSVFFFFSVFFFLVFSVSHFY